MTSRADDMAQRVILSIAVGAVATFLTWHAQVGFVSTTDFAQIWHAARGWLSGHNPYDIVGPAGAFRWPFPLLYPGTAIVVGVPFGLAPLRAASAAFVGCGAGALAWSLSRHPSHPGRWFVFASASFAYVIRTAQWSPLLMASALTPTLGWLLACKPTVGAALLAAYPTRRTAVGITAFAVASIALLPTWPRDWVAALPTARHMTAPVTYLSAGGPLILLGLLRWRRPEARLVVALGCVPHTTMLYESLPLFLVVSRWYEGLILAALTWVCFALPESRDYLDRMHETAWRMTALLYLPCVVMILLRKPVETAGTSTREGVGDDSMAAASP